MENKNIDGFKPLSQDEEKKVSGGGQPISADPCAPIASQIAAVEQKIEMMARLGQPVPPPVMLQLQQLQQQYRICEAQAPHH
jgi:hypothetical protein